MEECAAALKGGDWAPARWDNPVHAAACDVAVREARERVGELEEAVLQGGVAREEAERRLAELTDEVTRGGGRDEGTD